jgi:hypothetical protein
MRHLSASLVAGAKLSTGVHPSFSTLPTPSAEEIARAIWQRQHDALEPSTIASMVCWRDPSIPSRYWEEFLKDAEAVLSLFYSKQVLCENGSASIQKPDDISEADSAPDQDY